MHPFLLHRHHAMARAFTPAGLFAGNAGGMYHPLVAYQETTPVTAANDPAEPVGLVVRQAGTLDFTQGTAGSKPIFAKVPPVGVFNMLAFSGAPSENFSDAAWTKLNVTATANTTTAPDGAATGNTMEATGGASNQYIRRTSSFNFVSGRTYTFSAYAKLKNVRYFRLGIFGNAFTTKVAYFDLQTGAVSSDPNSANPTITSLGNGWYRCSMENVATSTNTGIIEFLQTTSSNSNVGAAVGEGTYVWGAMPNPGSLLDYQKVTSRNLVEQAGMPLIECLTTDGGDHMANGSNTPQLFADTGQNWSITVIASTFGSGAIASQTDTATAANQMFQVAFNAGVQRTTIRGAANDSASVFNDGKWNVTTITCTNGVVTRKQNRNARSTLTVGTAAAETTNLRMMCRTAAGTPGNILTGGYMLGPPQHIDKAYSVAEEDQLHAFYCDYLQIP